ncbi:MAG: hypothetical protein ACKO20_03755 [Actinomycetota bacterium]
MDKNKNWRKGDVKRITKDSFYIKPYYVIYRLMGTDTIRLNTEGYSIKDVYAFPNSGILIDYKNGHYQVSGAGGHVHFYWMQSGWLLRAGAFGYAALNLLNGGILNGKYSFSQNKTALIASAATWLFGEILKKNYKPYIKVGKRYKVNILER